MAYGRIWAMAGLVSVLATLWASDAWANELKRVAVMPLRAEGADPLLAGSLTRLMETTLQQTGRYTIWAIGDMGAILRFDWTKGELGCNTEDCRASLRETLQKVDQVATGDVRLTAAGEIEVALVLLDAQNMARLGSEGPVRLPAEDRAMRDEFVRAVERMVASTVAPVEPTVRRAALPPNSLIVLPLRDRTQKLSESLRVSVSSILAGELAQLARFSLVHQTEVDDILKRTTDPLRVLQHSGARYAMAMELLQVGNDCQLKGELFERGQATAVLTVPARDRCREEDLLALTESLAASVKERLEPTKTLWPVWLMTGVTVVGAGVGTGLLLSSASDVEKRNVAATPEEFNRFDSAAESKALGGTISLAVAGVGAATGIVWLIVQLATDAPDPLKTAALSPASGGGWALMF